MWEKLPHTMRTRQPKLLYRASIDGYNMLNTYFERMKQYESDSKSSLVFIQTTDDETFGVFFDDVIRLKMKEYSGQFENFLFSSIVNQFRVFQPTSVNPADFKSTDRFFEIGPSRQAIKENHSNIELCPYIYIQKRPFDFIPDQ